MAQNIRVTGPLKLPKAPKGYDERDQDHTRRLIELALMAYSRQLQETADSIGASTQPIGKDYIPVSPIHGTVSSLGNAGGTPAFAQLLNPSDSGKIVVIYELSIAQEGTASQQIRLRTTDIPSTLGGTTVTAVLARRDETDVTAITSTLKACDVVSPNPPFTVIVQAAGTNYEDIPFWHTIHQAAQADAVVGPFWIVKPGMMPIVLLPGMALEATEPTTGATQRITMHVCFDELDQTTVLGTDAPGDPTRIIDSIFAGLRIQGSINDGPFIQFYNPGPKYAIVTGLYVLTDATNFTSIRRTPDPISIFGGGASVLIAATRRMNRGNIDPPLCVLRGTNITANAADFATASSAGPSFWRDKGRSAASGLPFAPIVSPFGFPIVVKPNSAIEISVAATGTVFAEAFLVWDEVDELPAAFSL